MELQKRSDQPPFLTGDQKCLRLYLREQAHIEKDVTLAGVGQTVELWDTARLAENLGSTQENFREISSGIAEKLRS